MAKARKKSQPRRRKAKETAADKVDVRKAGSAQYKLPEPERIDHHLSNTGAWEKKLKDLKAHVKKAYEAAAIDGISKELLNDLRALQEGDPITARQYLESLGIGLKVIGCPFQLNVFDTMFESDVAQARAEARIHAQQGKSPECRFAEGSEAAEAYLDEYRFINLKRAPGAENLSDEDIRKAMAQTPAEAAAGKGAGAHTH